MTQSLRSLSLLWTVVAAFVVGPGCRRDPGGTPGPAPGPAGRATAPAGKPFRIAMIANNASNLSVLSARRGAEDRARALSVTLGTPIEIVWLTPAQEDGHAQAQRVLQAVNELDDAILISCSDDETITKAIDDAVSRGIPVMTFDSDAPRSKRFSYVGIDDAEVGKQLMVELAGVVAAPAKIAILAGNPGAQNLQRRVEGIKREAARYPGLRVVGTFFHDETPQGATTEMLRAMASTPDIAGWVMVGGWPLYTKTLLGEALTDAGKIRYKVVSVNALPPQLVYVERGVAPVLLAQPTYEWGAVGVETIIARTLQRKAVPPYIALKPVKVTAQNLGTWARQLKTWGFGDVPDEYLRLK